MVNGKTLLIVEEDGSLRDCLRDILRLEGYSAVFAQSGMEGLRMIDSGNPPAVIFFDFTNATPDGWNFLERLRADPKLESIPVIVSSGVVEEAVLKFASSLILKPYNIETLLEVVERYAR